jgi:Asp-tRNA(Asn)/Glu-tRNA(Gln) amidotransferase A subunit family amidase
MHTAETLLDAWMQRDLLRMKIFAQMQRYPILLCPVASIPAFKHGEREWIIDGQTVKYLDAWSYCEWFNLLGCPAVVVPAGSSAKNLPIGVQIVGRPWEEEVALEVAAIIERECGGGKMPPIA